MSLAPGTRLGPYELVAALGAGGMGDVYRARDPRLGRDVAIKVISGSVAEDPTAHDRFEREARAVAALAHPNILALFDVGTERGTTFVVTELLDGETLRERLVAGGALPSRRALEYASQVARGLAAAHERGIVHRDLKPENLFLTADGRVKILDFGIAQWEPPAQTEDTGEEQTRFATSAGILVGTPGYVSPEQASGAPATPRSDVFALGVVLYEMLTGRHPFARATVFETLTAILRDDPPPLDGVAGLPAGVARLVERCLEKRPADRPGTAGDVAFLLEALGARSDSVPAADAAAPVPTAAGPGLAGMRWRLLALSIGVPLLLIVATSGYIQVMAARIVTQALDADLSRAEAIVARVHQDRLNRLRLTARLVASFPELKALFETDPATIRDYLLGYQQRNPGAGVLLAFGDDGDLIARTDQPVPVGEDDWLVTLLRSPDAMAIVMLDTGPHHAAAVASDARGTVFGYIVAAHPVDGPFAHAISDATQDDVVLLAESDTLGSTLRVGRAPWTSLNEWRGSGGREGRTTETELGGRRISVREVPLATAPAVSAVLVKSNDEAIAPYRRIQRGLMVIFLGALALAAIGTLWVTRRIPRPAGRSS